MVRIALEEPERFWVELEVERVAVVWRVVGVEEVVLPEEERVWLEDEVEVERLGEAVVDLVWLEEERVAEDDFVWPEDEPERVAVDDFVWVEDERVAEEDFVWLEEERVAEELLDWLEEERVAEELLDWLEVERVAEEDRVWPEEDVDAELEDERLGEAVLLLDDDVVVDEDERVAPEVRVWATREPVVRLNATAKTPARMSLPTCFISLSFIKFILFGQPPEIIDIRVPITRDLGNLKRAAEYIHYIIRAANLVEHRNAVGSDFKRVLPIEFMDGLHDVELYECQGRRLIISEEELDPVDEFSAETSEERFVVDRTEFHSRNVEGIQAGLEGIGVDPLLRESREGEGVAYANVKVSPEFSRQPRAGVTQGRVGIGDVRRGQHPGKAGVGIKHVPRPSLHRDNGETALQRGKVTLLPAVEPFLVDEGSQFPYGKSI